MSSFYKILKNKYWEELAPKQLDPSLIEYIAMWYKKNLHTKTPKYIYNNSIRASDFLKTSPQSNLLLKKDNPEKNPQNPTVHIHHHNSINQKKTSLLNTSLRYTVKQYPLLEKITQNILLKQTNTNPVYSCKINNTKLINTQVKNPLIKNLQIQIQNQEKSVLETQKMLQQILVKDPFEQRKKYNKNFQKI